MCPFDSGHLIHVSNFAKWRGIIELAHSFCIFAGNKRRVSEVYFAIVDKSSITCFRLPRMLLVQEGIDCSCQVEVTVQALALHEILHSVNVGRLESLQLRRSLGAKEIGVLRDVEVGIRLDVPAIAAGGT